MSKRKLILSVLINGVLLSSLYVAGAVDVAPGSGNGVAIVRVAMHQRRKT